MIFDELTLFNFGIYKGQHSVCLSPKSPKKPIVLLGGLNGGGKTTLLDALQLVLYGKFARTSNRSNLRYDEYLLQTINKYSPPHEGAWIALKFRYFSEGEEYLYTIIRKWRSTGKTLKEDLEVSRNGVYDAVITDNWYEYVSEFIPLNISSLFFFDGEKIEDLAEPYNSSSILQTGIYSLLGLDLVDKLNADITTIERRKKLNNRDVAEDADIKELQRVLDRLSRENQEIAEDLASKRSQLDNAENRLRKVKDKYRIEGGELFEKSASLEQNRVHIEKNLADVKEELRTIAEGDAPLLMLSNFISELATQAQKEEDIRRNEIIIDELSVRDSKLLYHLESDIDSKTLSAIRRYLYEDLEKRKGSIQGKQYLHIEPEFLLAFNKTRQKRITKSIRSALQRYAELNEELSNLDRKLSSIPKPEAIQELQSNASIIEEEITNLNAEINILSQQYEKNDTELKNTKGRYSQKLNDLVEMKYRSEHERRILSQCEKARAIIITFKNRLIERHIRKLEELVLQSFVSLIQKSDLVASLTIDPESFALYLFDEKGRELPAKRLSAGERQLLAISILWGLSKASGRPLPAIIDTPLGRLDSQHRSQMIENYFPKASHQVILLSTDEEIDKNYRNDLAPRIGREYRIEYDPNMQTSTIQPGYF